MINYSKQLYSDEYLHGNPLLYGSILPPELCKRPLLTCSESWFSSSGSREVRDSLSWTYTLTSPEGDLDDGDGDDDDHAGFDDGNDDDDDFDNDDRVLLSISNEIHLFYHCFQIFRFSTFRLISLSWRISSRTRVPDHDHVIIMVNGNSKWLMILIMMVNGQWWNIYDD